MQVTKAKAPERVLALQEQTGPYENVQVLPGPRQASLVPSEAPTGVASITSAKVVGQQPESQSPLIQPKTKSKSPPPPLAPKPVLSAGDPKLRIVSSEPKSGPPASTSAKPVGTSSRTPRGTPPPTDITSSAPAPTREATRTGGGLFDSLFHRARSPARTIPEKKRSSPNK